MAAFTTAVACIHKTIDKQSPIFVGDGSYFENKRVLREWFGDRVQLMDEMDATALIQLIQTNKPCALFLDTLGNTPSVTMPDLATLIPELSRLTKHQMYLVLDNSTRATSFQPLTYLPRLSKLELIVIESLNKYHQYGFDRVTGGILWTAGMFADYPFRTRMHLGTNMPDTSVLALPEPNRKLLDRRLARIGRNTHSLAQHIESYLTTHTSLHISHVVYPGLPSYPGFVWTKDETFHGGCFVLMFKEKYRHPETYAKFVDLVMKLAKKRKIDLVGGSSFGLDTTRVYLTARGVKIEDGEPFIRISPGTETRLEMEEIEKLFMEAIERF
jgi:cystathionine beta-lyase/cystathionine gamma-synthase